MTKTRHLPIRTTAVLVLCGLAVVSCGSDGDDDSTGAAPSSDTATTAAAIDPPVTEPAVTEPAVTEPAVTEPAVTEPAVAEPAVTEPAVTDPTAIDPPATDPPPTGGPHCPVATPVPDLTPVEADAQPLPAEEEMVPLDAGRYRDERLGLSLAFDVGEGFEVPLRTAGAITMFGLDEIGVFNLLRPAGFITEEPSRGTDPELIDLEGWLSSGLVTIESDTPRTVAGFPARDLVLTVQSDSEVAPLTMAWGLNPATARMTVIDVGGDDPLLAISEPNTPGDPAFTEATDRIIDSLAIGDVGPSFETVFAETPWDVGNLDFPVSVPDCPVPLVAFGETVFELAAPARIFGQGDQIWIVAPDEPWEGTAPPFIQLVGPATATFLEDFSRRNGQPILTTDDAVVALEAAGYLLTPASADATLLGAVVTAFDFEGPEEPVSPWLARSHAASVGDTNVNDAPFRNGLIYIAETKVGVVVARVDGERGTKDLDLMRERFDTLVGTLEFR